MKRNFFAAILCGSLIGFSGGAFADTTDASAGAGTAPGFDRGQGGMRGGRGGMGMRGGMRGGRGGMGMRGGMRGGMGMRGGGMGFGGMMLSRTSREAEIQQKFPKEYAEIAKQLIDAENKLQELAKKAKVELPVDNNSVLRQLKMKAPKEFAEIENMMKSRETMRSGFEKLRALAEKHNLKLAFGMGGMRRNFRPEGNDAPAMRKNPVAAMRMVREKFPEEWKKVTELRKAGKRREADELVRDLVRRVEHNAPATQEVRK